MFQIAQFLASYDVMREEHDDAYFLLASIDSRLSVHTLDQFETIHTTTEAVRGLLSLRCVYEALLTPDFITSTIFGTCVVYCLAMFSWHQVYFVSCDASTRTDVPGWTVRNLLSLIAYHW